MTLPSRRPGIAPALMALGLLAVPGATAIADEVEEIVVVAARLPRPVTDVAGTVDVIDRDELIESLVLRPADLVRYLPGVSSTRADTRFGDTGLTIRGLSGNRVTTLIDRVPVSDAFAVGAFSNAGQEFLTPEAISRVEILRGPASTLFGSDALGGVVAIVTREPDELLGDDRELGLDAFAGWSGADTARTVGFTGAARHGALSGLLHASGLLGEELDASATDDVDALERTRGTLLGKLALELPSGDRLRLKGETFREDVTSDLEAVLGYGRQFASTTALEGDDARRRSSVVLGVDLGSWPGIEGGAVDLYWHRSRVEQRTDELRAGADPPLAIERRFDYRYEDLGALVDLESALELAGVENRIGWGLSVRGSDVEELRDGRQVDLATGEATTTLLGEDLPVRDFPDTRIVELGVYVHDEARLGDVVVLPGIRFELYDLDARADALYREDNPDKRAVDVHETAWVPKLGLLYRPTDSVELFAQYARGFRAPPFEDVNIGLEIPRFNVRAIPNPDLKAETSDGIEVGARWRAGALHGSVAFFGADYDDFIVSKVPLGPDPESGVLLFQSRNVDEARIYGAELTLGASLDRFVEGLRVDVAGSFTRGENRTTDEPLDTVDPPELVTWLRWAPVALFDVGLGVTVADAQTRADSSEIDPFTPDSFVVLDLTASLRPLDGLRIDAGVFNLTNETYWRWSSVRGRPEDDPLIDLLSEPGRYGAVTVHLSL